MPYFFIFTVEFLLCLWWFLQKIWFNFKRSINMQIYSGSVGYIGTHFLLHFLEISRMKRFTMKKIDFLTRTFYSRVFHFLWRPNLPFIYWYPSYRAIGKTPNLNTVSKPKFTYLLIHSTLTKTMNSTNIWNHQFNKYSIQEMYSNLNVDIATLFFRNSNKRFRYICTKAIETLHF